MATATETKKKTISEWLTEVDLALDKNEVIWLSTKVAQEFRKRYPDEDLRKVYRPNSRGKHVQVGYGYDDRIMELIGLFIEL